LRTSHFPGGRLFAWPVLAGKAAPGAAKKAVGGLAGMEGAKAIDLLVEKAVFEGEHLHVFDTGEVVCRFRRGGELRSGRGLRGGGGHFAEEWAENAARVEAMTAGVLGRAQFAGGGAGAAGSGAVEASRLALEFGAHEWVLRCASAQRLASTLCTRGSRVEGETRW